MREKQGKPAAKKALQLAGLLALVLVSAYIIVQFFVIFHQSYKTETAIKYTLAESINLDGVVVFDAVDVPGSGDLGYLVQDGERVTNGTVVAECYTDDAQGLQRERLDRLSRTITLLTKSQNSSGSDLSVLTNQTKQSLYNLLDKLDSAQYSGIADAEDNFLLAQNRLQVSTGQTEGFSTTIAALQTEYDSIKSQLDALQTITATTNGYFSSVGASPAIKADRQALDDADPATLQQMLSTGFPAADSSRAGQDVYKRQGSDRLLKEMNRHYNVEQYLSLIDYAKEKIPGVTFSSDIIVGFPGETEGDFTATLDLIRKVGYMQLFTFIYSKRAGTPAAKLPDPTPHAEKAARMERLLKTQETFAFAATAAMAGQTVRVLVEAAGRSEGTVNGRLDNNLVVEFKAPAALIGQWARVHVTGSRAALLVGELAEDVYKRQLPATGQTARRRLRQCRPCRAAG